MDARAIAKRAHGYALCAFAATLALVEGPAQIACVLVILTALASGRAQSQRLGLLELGVLVWWLAGVPGLLGAEVRPSSGELTRPLAALALLVGRWSIDPEDERSLITLAWIFGAAIAFNGAYGIAQFSLGPFPWAWDKMFLKNPSSGQIWIPGRVHHELAASGLFYNRLKLAHVGIVGLALFGVVIASPTVRRRTRAFAAIGASVLGLGVLLTYARAAILALVLATSALAARLARRSTVLKVAAISALVAVAFLATRYGRQRWLSIGDDTSLRLGLFRGSLELSAEHPLFGVGHGGYAHAIGPFLPAGASGVHLTSPHNLWLQVLAETGIIGLFGFMLALGVALVGAGRNVRARIGSQGLRADFDRWVFVSLLATTLTGLTHSTLHHAPVALLFWALAGAATRKPSA